MERRVKLASRVVAMTLAAHMVSGLCMPSTAPATEPGGGGGGARAADVVASVKIGTGVGEVGVEEGPEEAWGVSAFAVGPDGAFYLVDGVNDKIVVLDRGGAFLREIALPEPLVGPEDIAVTESGIYVMDAAAQPAVVCRLGDQGAIERLWPVPDEYRHNATTGIAVQNEDGEDVFLELERTWHVPLVEDGLPAVTRCLPLVRRGNRADVPIQDAPSFGLRSRVKGDAYSTSLDAEDGRVGTLICNRRGRTPVSMRVIGRGDLAGLKALGSDVKGQHFALVDEASEDGVVTTVHVFSPSGAERAVLRVPTHRFVTQPNTPLRLAEDGSVFCLVPEATRVCIERLQEEPQTQSLAPSVREASGTADERSASSVANENSPLLSRLWSRLKSAFGQPEAHAAWTRLNASDRAWEFVDLAWYCSKANYVRSCGDYRPAYLTAYGKTYYGVPYCWGGFNTVSAFKTAMKDGKDAGDVNTSGSKRYCTAGVDCSGFVSRVWGLGTKFSTKTLLNISYAISPSSMKVGDIYNRGGSHSIVFRYYTSNNRVAVWESTTLNDKDRVIAWARDAGTLSGYDARRYVNW